MSRLLTKVLQRMEQRHRAGGCLVGAGMARAFAAIALILSAACGQRGAPVVDSPVWDGAPQRPATASTAPGAKPAPAPPAAASPAAKPADAAPPASPSAAPTPSPSAAPAPPPSARPAPSPSATPAPSASATPAPSASATPAPSPSAKPAPAPPEPSARTTPAAARATADAEALPEFYTVRKGDTLYSIALDNGQDYKDVAAWNGITDANVIRVDQQLRVRAPPDWKDPAEDESGVVARAVSPAPEIQARPLEAPPVKSAPKAVKMRYSEQALAQMRGMPFKPVPEPAVPAASVQRAPQGGPQAAPSTARAKPLQTEAPVTASKPAPASSPSSLPPSSAAGAAPAGEIAWGWPARGALLQPFNQGPNPKGIAIGGELGQTVLAGAAGKVVYSGSGLRGYGKLVIIKHDATYLSVYAHNRELRVKEGERVARGQPIADMGSFDAERPGLHFEIRRLGKPVDPLQYLPAKGG